MNNKIHTHESREGVEDLARTIQETLVAFGAPVEVVEAVEGLHLFHFKLKTLKPVRMRAMKAFEDDLRYALGISKLEIEAPMKDESFIGITVTKKQEPVTLEWSDAIKEDLFNESDDLVVPLGKSEFNESHYVDIRRLPHLLIGGTTGSGKSVLLHSIINSLIKKHSPERVRFIFIDPKRIDLTLYSNIPHVLTPTIVDAKKVIIALKWCIKEMERRLDIFQEARVQNISTYHTEIYENKKHAKENPEPLPYIVVVIDELSDLMVTYPRELETCVIRLLQMCRAVGIHLIFATQRPSVNVITGLMKANIPSRIALEVASYIDSRTILDQSGAENLIGRGDMLFLSNESPRPVRLQGYYISYEQIAKNIKNIMRKYATEDDRATLNLDPTHQVGDTMYVEGVDDEDDLYEEVKEEVIKTGKASTSQIQRKFRIGYSRAAGLMDILEERRIIGPADGSTPRKVIKGKVE